MDKIGHFTILEKFKDGTKYKYKLRCECGKELIKRADYLKDPRAKDNCGCKEGKKKDLLKAGAKFGRLTVCGEPIRSNGSVRVRCICDCGNEINAYGYDVIKGETQSCGCYNTDILKSRAGKNHPMYSHGKANSKEYSFWKKIKDDTVWTQKEFFEWCSKTEIKSHLAKHKYNFPYSENNAWFTDDEEEIKNDIEEKRKVTSINNCGFESYTQTEEFHKRRVSTNLEKYGVEYPIQNDLIKEKIEQTNLNKYGVKHHLSSQEIREKASQTNINKYGHESASKNELVKQKIKDAGIKDGRFHITKDGKTTLDLSIEKGVCKSTMVKWIKNYGLDSAELMDKNKSGIENKIKFLLDEYNINYKDEFYIDGKYADFCLLDYNILIEANGCRWHSDEIIEDRNHHKNRRENFLKAGYETLFFNEDEINEKFDIVKSIILNKIGKSKRIYARKCDVVEISKQEAKKFFSENHLMGAGQGRCIALIYNDEIVCAIRLIKRNGYTEISRFSHKLETCVVGGLSKLLSKIDGTIKSFVDLRYGNGKSLEKLGFKLESNNISFKWTYGGKTYHRLTYPGNDGYKFNRYKIWDCGQALYSK